MFSSTSSDKLQRADSECEYLLFRKIQMLIVTLFSIRLIARRLIRSKIPGLPLRRKFISPPPRKRYFREAISPESRVLPKQHTRARSLSLSKCGGDIFAPGARFNFERNRGSRRGCSRGGKKARFAAKKYIAAD